MIMPEFLFAVHKKARERGLLNLTRPERLLRASLHSALRAAALRRSALLLAALVSCLRLRRSWENPSFASAPIKALAGKLAISSSGNSSNSFSSSSAEPIQNK